MRLFTFFLLTTADPVIAAQLSASSPQTLDISDRKKRFTLATTWSLLLIIYRIENLCLSGAQLVRSTSFVTKYGDLWAVLDLRNLLTCFTHLGHLLWDNNYDVMLGLYISVLAWVVHHVPAVICVGSMLSS